MMNRGEQLVREYRIEIVRSSRRTICLQVKPDGSAVVRAPLRMSLRQIYAFVEQQENWLKTKTEKAEQKQEQMAAVEILTEAELKALAKKAKEIIPQRAAYYAPLVGVTYGNITIRAQRTRWGSCSSKGNLNFNCLLMLAPMEVLDSVVVHELCHRKEMNHSKRFYEEVLRVYPSYHKWHNWLKSNGASLLRRLG